MDTIISFVIQSTWDDEEDQELLAHVKASKKQLTILDEASIANISPATTRMVFADTLLIQRLFSELDCLIPDTYPPEYNPLFKRIIKKTALSALLPTDYPVFVKPTGNGKHFDGRVLKTIKDATLIDDHDAELYACEVVQFVCEHRLFLGPNKVYGVREYSDNVLDPRLMKEGLTVPSQLVSRCLEINGQRFAVVDVGMTQAGQWCVVEVNPPFALSSYGLEIGVYVAYCVEAWQWMCNMLQLKNKPATSARKQQKRKKKIKRKNNKKKLIRRKNRKKKTANSDKAADLT